MTFSAVLSIQGLLLIFEGFLCFGQQDFQFITAMMTSFRSSSRLELLLVLVFYCGSALGLRMSCGLKTAMPSCPLGGCAGSTGGSLKILRVMILLKQARSELKRLLHPHAVIPVRMDERVVSSAIVSNILSFILFYIFISSSLVMSFLGLDVVSALSSVAATLGNVGPGSGIVSPASNYSSIPSAGKWLLSFCMLAGRLEVYTLLVLLTKDFWK